MPGGVLAVNKHLRSVSGQWRRQRTFSVTWHISNSSNVA